MTYIKALEICYKNYFNLLKTLPPSVTPRVKDTKKMVKAGIKRFKTLKQVTPKIAAELEEEARIMDNLYDILECYPEAFQLPSTYKPIAMPFMQSIVESEGIYDSDIENIYLKEATGDYLPFNWRA